MNNILLKHQNLLEELTKLLETDPLLVSEGKLLKNKIIELTLAMDARLIKKLLGHEGIKKHFFADADGVLVFDKIKFQQFVSNKSFLPDSYTAFKNKIGLTAEGSYLTDSKEVVLAWPYKDCVLEGGQTKDDAKRDEVFWNETLAPDQIDRLLAPKVLTNFKKFDKDGEHPVSTITPDDNLIIKGNNLLALHTLKSNYAGRVKLIYIDPPFNTGDDEFKYNDKFNHSSWMTFTLNRLKVAKQMLAPDGVFVFNIGNEEASYAKVMLDEVFGREHFINQVTMTTNDPSGFKATSSKIFSTSNYLFIYGNSEKAQLNKLYVPKDGYDDAYKFYLLNRKDNISDWKYISIKEALARELGYKDSKTLNSKFSDSELFEHLSKFADKHREIVFRTAAISGGALKKRSETVAKSKANKGIVMQHPNEDAPNFYILNGEQILFWANTYKNIDGVEVPATALTDVWTDIKWTGIANEGGVELKNGKKPEKLMRRIIELTTSKDNYVLDYHLGSGTTCAVAHKLGRRFIGCEQLDYGENDPVARLKAVIDGDKSGISNLVNWQGGGSFIYCELAKANQIFIDQIQNAENSQKLVAIWQMMQEKAFLSYRVDPKKINLTSDDFTALSLDDQKRFLVEVMDKNMLYVPVSEIDDVTYGVSESDKTLNRQFFSKS